MSKLLTAVLAAVFAMVTVSPVAFAQDQKKAQVDKGTPAQGTVQKKDQTKAKTDAKKKTTTKKKAQPKKGDAKKAAPKGEANKGEGKK